MSFPSTVPAGAGHRPSSRAGAGRAQLRHVYELGRVGLEAVSAVDAAERVFAILSRVVGVRKLVLELSVPTGIQLSPFGDPTCDALDGRLESVELPLDECQPAAGLVTICFDAAGPPVDTALLRCAVDQIGVRRALDLAAERADQAEDKARQRISEVAALYEIGQAIDPAQLQKLLQMIIDRTCHLMDAQASSLMLVDEAEGRLRLVASRGLAADVPALGQKLGEGIAGRVVATEQPLLIVDSVRDPRLEGLTLKPEIGSSMLVPMKDQAGKVLGVLAIRRRRPAPDFTPDDLRLFSVFATQAALAVANNRLYDTLTRRAAELLKLATLSRTLIATTNLDQLLDNVVDEIRSVVSFERVCLFVRDTARSAYIPRVWRGYPPSIRRNPVREGEGAIGLAIRAGKPVSFDTNEPVSEERLRERSYLQLKGFARALGADSFVAAPILVGQGRCAGVLVADNRGRKEPISTEQKSLLAAFVGQVGIAIDNSQLYAQMQDTLGNIRRLKEYTDRVLQSIGVAILSTDGTGMVARWNPAAEQTLGLAPSAIAGATVQAILERMGLPEPESQHLHDLIDRVKQTGENLPRTRLMLHPAGREPMAVYLMVSRLPEHSHDHSGVVIILEDVTQEVRMEAEIERMRRLADIGQLASRMAHEVRNALSPIRGAAQIVRSDLVAQGASTEWPDIIITEVDGLSRLTGEMLEFARPTSLALKRLDVGSFLEGSVQSLASFLQERQASVEWDLHSRDPLWADPVLLGQVIRNVVMNAAQAMPRGGPLLIRSTFDAGVRIHCIEVRDSGVGIAPADVERMFRPFVTTRAKGTGLGLPIVQKIVVQHGGRVEVESQVGAGASFRILLPQRPPDDAGAPAGERAVDARTQADYPSQ